MTTEAASGQAATTMSDALSLVAEALPDLVPETAVVVGGERRYGPSDARFVLRLNSPSFLGEVLRAPRGLGLARAWVKGYVDLEGDLVEASRLETNLRTIPLISLGLRATLSHLKGTFPRPLMGTGPSEAEYRGRTGSQSSDSSASSIGYHYDLSPEFFRIVLGESMVYSGAMPAHDTVTLTEAQNRKLDVLLSKLDLFTGARLLDIGCGWGALLERAADHRELSAAHGFTASAAQAEYATRILADRPEVSVVRADWRQMSGTYDRIASIGMYEHVGHRAGGVYLARVRDALATEGRYVHQSIVNSPERRKRFRKNSFAQRFVFPDGEIPTLPDTLDDLAGAGLEVKDVEAFGPSYAWTLGQWRKNLESNTTAIEALIGSERYRAWRLYLAGSEFRFATGALDVVQIVADR